MTSLSKKYNINYNKRYTISKNKKQRGNKSIKVYNNRVKPMSRKRKHYIGGDIKVPQINNIFPSGQTYQPNTDCLEKECYKKDDAGEKTTTCLNTQVIMNLFSQSLDASEKETMNRIHVKSTEKERNQVKDLTEKYLTNYVSSLFSKSIFSKNNVDLTPGNTTKLKELLQVIDPLYVDYLRRDSNLSDDIKEKILAVKQELNIVDTAVATPAPATSTAPIDNAITPAPVPAPTNANATANATAVVEADQAKKDAEAEEAAKKATEDAEAEKLRLEAEEATKKAADDVEAERLRLEAEETAKKAAEDAEAAKKVAEAERLRVIAEIDQAKKAVINETLKVDKIKTTAVELANNVYKDAIEEAEKIRTAAFEIANQDLDTNIQKKDRRYASKHDRALKLANDAYTATKKKAEKVKNEAIAEAVKAQSNAKDAIKRKLLAKKNLLASQTMNKP
jgi:hypothetical protein